MPSKTQQIDKFKKKKETNKRGCLPTKTQQISKFKKEREREKERNKRSCVVQKLCDNKDTRENKFKKKRNEKKRSCDTEVVCQQTHKT